MDEKQFKGRTGMIIVILVTVCALFFGVLYDLQKVNGGYYWEESTRKIANTETVDAARGEILDRYGQVLISNRSTYEVTLDSSLMGETDQRNENLAQLLEVCRAQGVTWTDTLPISTTAPFNYTQSQPFSYTLTDDQGTETSYDTNFGKVLSDLSSSYGLNESSSAQEVMDGLRTLFSIDPALSDEEARGVVGVLYEMRLRTTDIVRTTYIFNSDVDIDFIAAVKERNLTGVRIETATAREYNTTYAAHLLGRVGEIWAEEVDYYLEQGYSQDEMVGKDGIELAFESYLRGESGLKTVELSTTGKVVAEEWYINSETGEEMSPEPGDNVVLTLDIRLQEVVERTLEQRIPELSSDQTQGAGVAVMDMTGGVLALASYPTYDISQLYSDVSYYNEVSSDVLNPLYNRATQGTYSPGSVFKMVTAVGALNEGLIDVDTQIICTGRYEYYSRIEDQPMCWIFRQYGSTHGSETVTQAIQDSCNIFFYDVGRQLGIDNINTYAAMFGLGEKTGIEVGDKAGVVASPSYSESVGQTWYEGNTMYVAIGQENTVCTPLQMANYVATLANGGDHYEAHLLKTVKTNDFSEVVEEYQAEPIDSIDIEQEHLDAVLYGMYLAANEGSVASYFADLDVTVAAKTGTAQVASESEANAVFVCFAPYENPEIAIAIVVEKGGSGTEIAAIAADILAYYFNTEEAIDTATSENTLLP